INFSVMNTAGDVLLGVRQGNSRAYRFGLDAGKYVIRVQGWNFDQSAQVPYQLRLSLIGSSDNPPALTVAPAPAIRVRVADAPSLPEPTTPTPPTTPPPSGDPGSNPVTLPRVSPHGE